MNADRDAIAAALEADRTIDIVTVGARTGLSRRTEISFTNIDGEIYICGTPANDGSVGPRPRDWLANLQRHPDFRFCLKESVVADVGMRTRVFSAPQTRWYREYSPSLDALNKFGELVAVRFVGEAGWLNG